MPRSMVGVLAAVGTAMSALVAFAHGDVASVMIADAAAAAGLAAYLAIPSQKKTFQIPDFQGFSQKAPRYLTSLPSPAHAKCLSLSKQASHTLLAMGSKRSDDSVDDLIRWIFAPPFTLPSTPPHETAPPSTIGIGIRYMLSQAHSQSSVEPVRYPDPAGAFSSDLLMVVPPVVPDACTLRDDLLYSAGRDTRTVLVNAANGGLFRLFCAEHVINEVFKHSGDWTEGKQVSQEAFLRRWLTDYLPVIRVLPDDAIPDELLTPDERSRLAELSAQGSKDIPSVKLAMVLGAYYHTVDRPALRAAYGAGVDVAAHDEWRDILRAGGDAGQLSEMAQTVFRLSSGLAVAGFQGARSLLRFTGPLGVLPVALALYLGYKSITPQVKERIGSGLTAALNGLVECYALYCTVRQRFAEASVSVLSWDELSAVLTPEAVLTRACLHTLARAGMSNCSARQLRSLLPVLPVPSGEAKVRLVLRSFPCFSEVYAGYWQVGEVAQHVQWLLSQSVYPDHE